MIPLLILSEERNRDSSLNVQLYDMIEGKPAFGCSPLLVAAHIRTRTVYVEETHLFICWHINKLELAESYEVGADEQSQFSPFLLSLFPITRMTLMLHTHP